MELVISINSIQNFNEISNSFQFNYKLHSKVLKLSN